MHNWLLRLGTFLPLGVLTWGVVTLSGWNHPARLDPQTVRASHPLLLACEADLRRNHPRERPFQLSLRQDDTVENAVSGSRVKWELSGTLTRSGDADLYFFDCTIDQQDDVPTVTYSHASLWFTLPPS